MDHPQTLSERLGAVIRGHMEERGVTFRAAATDTGIPLTTLVRRLNGQSPFTVTELAAFAHLFDVNLSTLAAEAEEVRAA